jgi:hypothetical protein
MLDLNIEVMKRMQVAALKASDLDGEKIRRKYVELNEGLESAISEHVFLRKNVLNLVARATILSNQVSPSPSFLLFILVFFRMVQGRRWLTESKASRYNPLP